VAECHEKEKINATISFQQTKTKSQKKSLLSAFPKVCSQERTRFPCQRVTLFVRDSLDRENVFSLESTLLERLIVETFFWLFVFVCWKLIMAFIYFFSWHSATLCVWSFFRLATRWTPIYSPLGLVTKYGFFLVLFFWFYKYICM